VPGLALTVAAHGLGESTWERPTAIGQFEEVFSNTGHFEYRKRNADGELIVGVDFAPLRAVWPTIEGKLSCECILDNGSQIVTMKDTIWEKLGNNLRIQECMEMESANSSRTVTNGRLRNVRFTFDDMDVYLQVQVMPNAPFDVLLGRPFHMLLACITRDFPNGDQQITIKDPNSDMIVTIPTVERNKKRRSNPDF
jgi:hypothetical protein